MWHNCLATSSNLHYRGIPIENQCLTCLHDNEDDHHIFQTCPLALEAWSVSALSVQPLDQPSLSMASWLELWLGKFLKEDGCWRTRVPTFISTLWEIWNTRNDQVFRQVRATLQRLPDHAEEGSRQHTRHVQQPFPTSSLI